MATIGKNELEKIEILMRLNNLDLNAIKIAEKAAMHFSNKEKSKENGQTKKNRN